eukprot:Gregarina_sp_Poly_1__11156@NODE_907_length_5760_cov_97_276656_g646_i0_p2_GENE_NODE_907_length_5760_cov_97_276656_g646_i0NODE_907_length_5760_cov_97_276656_g646_i0_p2_ORF_typecomplete_len483_score60_34PseudoU_synth_2/PF00849_22/1_5e24_NODE_907_length_5760_cov_97_276656_g646_i037365184
MDRVLEFHGSAVPSCLHHLLPAEISIYGFRTSGLRHRQFVQTCKNRWKGKTLRECFASEYTARPERYYDVMIHTGFLRAIKFGAESLDTPKRRRLDPSLKLTGQESIIHESILAEAAVPKLPVDIVHIADDCSYIIVDKPPGIPCYPQGPFESNSVQKLLQHDPELAIKLRKDSLPCHFVSRLDRVTGGLIAVAFSGVACSELATKMLDWKKAYLAEVRGDFNDVREKEHVACLPWKAKTLRNIEACSIVRCSAPLEKLQHEPGTALQVQVSNDRGKPSESIFVLLRAMETKSLILCFPVTGRTHQLRCHLQYLGHPIFEDSLYDELSLKDTKSHEEYIVIEYTLEESQKITAALAIAPHLDSPSDPNTLIPIFKEKCYPDTIECVYFGKGSELQRRNHAFPDLALDSKGAVFSYHPFVTPWRIPLHACVYMRDAGGVDTDSSCIAVQKLPGFAEEYGFCVGDILGAVREVSECFVTSSFSS